SRGEAGMPLVRPLHRRADRHALLEPEVLAHADLVAVAEDRCAREREQEALRELDDPAVAEHRGEPATDPAPVELHRRPGAERLEDQALRIVRELADVE